MPHAVDKQGPGKGTLLHARPLGFELRDRACWLQAPGGNREGKRKVCGKTQVIPRTRSVRAGPTIRAGSMADMVKAES